MVESDHLLPLTDRAAPAGDRLVGFGLTEGPGRRRPGQGTARRRFFCDNETRRHGAGLAPAMPLTLYR